MIDSAAPSRYDENRRLVNDLVEVPELMGKPMLFLLNKKDLPDAIDEIQFSEQFELHKLAKKNKTDIRVVGLIENRHLLGSKVGEGSKIEIRGFLFYL